MAAGTAVAEGPHPHGVPQHDLLRKRRVRHRAGVARLLPAPCLEPHARRIGPARRHTSRSDALRPGRQPAPGEGPAARGPARDARAGRHHASRVLARRPRAAARSGGHPAPGDPGAGTVLHQLREAAARRHVRHRAGLRRRHARPHVHRPRSPAACASRHRQMAAQGRRPIGRAGGHRSARRSRARDVRRA